MQMSMTGALTLGCATRSMSCWVVLGIYFEKLTEEKKKSAAVSQLITMPAASLVTEACVNEMVS